MACAVLALGTNLGDRLNNLQQAVDALRRLPDTAVTALSRVYETDPVGYTDQPAFLNAVVRLETALSPHALLGSCLGIEAALGRVRTFANAPRVVDVDVLVYEGVTLDTPELTLPHPRMHQRAFVLVPLGDVAPEWRIGGSDFSAAVQAVGTNGVWLYEGALS